MTVLAIIGAVLLIASVAIAIVSVDRYSNFMARLRMVEPSAVQGLAGEYSDGWSKKNMEIVRYFWEKNYLTSPDPIIHSLGQSVRQSQLLALVVFGFGFVASLIAK